MNNAGTPNNAGHHDSTYNTALRGAVLAFQKTTARPTAGVDGISTTTSTSAHDVRDAINGHTNGALLAATSASRDDSLTRSLSPALSCQTTGTTNSTSLGRDHGLAGHRVIPQHAHPATGQSNLLLTPTKSPAADSRSPSLIAATLAASRSASPSPKIGPLVRTNANRPTTERPRSNAGRDSTLGSVVDLDLATDLSPIGPTNALISLFERKEDTRDPVKKSPAVSSVKKTPRTGPQPMTPTRAMSSAVTSGTLSSRPASSLAWEKAMLSSPSIGRGTGVIRSPRHDARDTSPPPSTSLLNAKTKPRPTTPSPKVVSRTNTIPVTPQPKRTPSKNVIDSLDTGLGSATSLTMKPAIQHRNGVSGSTHPVKPIGVEGGPGALIRRSSSSLSNDTFMSASSAPSPQPDSPRRKSPYHPSSETSRPLRPPSSQAVSIPPPSRPPMSQSPSQLPLDSLTNAIVAGSLASARVAPVKSKPPTPPPRQRTPHMRHTLRAPRSKSEEDVTGVGPQHKRKHLGKLSSRKKHAHHEGARKRWREEITTPERQRYEGLWASNRGLLLNGASTTANGLQGVDTSQLVANVVVRDIWTRSRLPFDELAEVWDLVDVRGKGVLDKSQFVVGMWLIDQRLRGRKIPRKVSDSVWGSAKGVRMSEPKGKK